jgi:hypothetical protein
MCVTEYLSALADFAEGLREKAERLDSDGDAMAESYAQFCRAGLHIGAGARMPLTGQEFCEALAILGEASGAFGFVALQQFVANPSLHDHTADSGWLRAGVAFGHLRNPDGPAPVWKNGRVNGLIPWMTGAGVFEKVVLGVRDAEGQEMLALADAQDCPAFRHSAPNWEIWRRGWRGWQRWLAAEARCLLLILRSVSIARRWSST